jgi:hypothetical protein
VSTPLTRAEALAKRPPAIEADALARCTWSDSDDGIDETSVRLISISPFEDGFLFQRQVWWFEEEALSWSLDEAQEWWMSPLEAGAIMRSLSRHEHDR